MTNRFSKKISFEKKKRNDCITHLVALPTGRTSGLPVHRFHGYIKWLHNTLALFFFIKRPPKPQSRRSQLEYEYLLRIDVNIIYTFHRTYKRGAGTSVPWSLTCTGPSSTGGSSCTPLLPRPPMGKCVFLERNYFVFFWRNNFVFFSRNNFVLFSRNNFLFFWRNNFVFFNCLFY